MGRYYSAILWNHLRDKGSTLQGMHAQLFHTRSQFCHSPRLDSRCKQAERHVCCIPSQVPAIWS